MVRSSSETVLVLSQAMPFCAATHAALVVGTVWIVSASFVLTPCPLYIIQIPALVVRDKGRSRFIRCGLVITVYLIVTSPLAIQPIFVQGRDDGITYVYSPGGFS